MAKPRAGLGPERSELFEVPSPYKSLPDLAERFEALEVVVFLQAAFDTELREDGHYLADGEANEIGGLAEGGFAILVSKDRGYFLGGLFLICRHFCGRAKI
jgi:hypothetical protein